MECQVFNSFKVAGDNSNRSISTSTSNEVELQIDGNDPTLLIVEEAIGNPLVIHTILEKLDFVDLKLSRLVSPTFNLIASKLLLKSSSCIVQLIYDPPSKSFRRHMTTKKSRRSSCSQVEKSQLTLTHLNDILETSINFPCSNFNFVGGGDLSDSQVSRFFNFDNIQVETVGLAESRHFDNLTSKSTFAKILELLAPKVHHLSLRGFDYDWSYEQESESVSEPEKFLNFNFPFLESLSWRGGIKTIFEILKNAPNLKSTVDFDFNIDIPMLIECNKIFTVKELYCDKETDVEKIVLFITAQFEYTRPWERLKTLDIFIDESVNKKSLDAQSALAASFEKLLEHNKDSLEKLNLTQLCAQFPYLKLPQFSRLRLLKLGHGRPSRVFPHRLDLTQTFPNLRCLDCTNLSSNWKKCFPPPDATRGFFKNVHTLVISARCTEGWMERLESFCPNFTQVRLHSRDSLDEILPLIFKRWKHLQSLEIYIDEYEEEFFYMDSILCGMDEETCERLKGLGDVEMQRIEGFQQLRVAPSICDLKELKWFKIVFDSYSHFKLVKPTRNYVPLSFVTGLYALSLMEDLRVTIEFDQNCPWINEIRPKFESIAPYVNLAHRHHDFVN